MNLSRVLLSCGSLSSQSVVSRSFRPVAKQLVSKRLNNNVIPRRQLMTSQETGGLRPFQNKKRIQLNHRIFAGTALTISLVELYFMFTKEDEINNFLGVEWNTAAVGLFLQCLFAPPLVFVLFAATFPW